MAATGFLDLPNELRVGEIWNRIVLQEARMAWPEAQQSAADRVALVSSCVALSNVFPALPPTQLVCRWDSAKSGNISPFNSPTDVQENIAAIIRILDDHLLLRNGLVEVTPFGRLDLLELRLPLGECNRARPHRRITQELIQTMICRMQCAFPRLRSLNVLYELGSHAWATSLGNIMVALPSVRLLRIKIVGLAREFEYVEDDETVYVDSDDELSNGYEYDAQEGGSFRGRPGKPNDSTHVSAPERHLPGLDIALARCSNVITVIIVDSWSMDLYLFGPSLSDYRIEEREKSWIMSWITSCPKVKNVVLTHSGSESLTKTEFGGSDMGDLGLSARWWLWDRETQKLTINATHSDAQALASYQDPWEVTGSNDVQTMPDFYS